VRLNNLDLEKEETHDCCRQSQRHNKVALHSRFLVNQQYGQEQTRNPAANKFFFEVLQNHYERLLARCKHYVLVIRLSARETENISR